MTRNPLINALAAFLYVAAIGAGMYYTSQATNGPSDSALVPVAVLSLLVFSAAVMAYIFFFEPIQMLVSGEKKAAADLFIKTALIFGILAVAAFGAALLASPSAPERAERYVTEHIAELSPEHPVLGGSFYVTAVHAADGKGTVSYEDGHIALTADFTYEIRNKELQITSFSIHK